MTLSITAAFAALILLLVTLLAINTTRLRLRAGNAATPAAKNAIYVASRAHGNNFEHGVVTILLLMFLEQSGLQASWLCGFGTAYLAARLLYSYGFLTQPAGKPMQAGAGLTYVLELVMLGVLLLRVL